MELKNLKKNELVNIISNMKKDDITDMINNYALRNSNKVFNKKNSDVINNKNGYKNISREKIKLKKNFKKNKLNKVTLPDNKAYNNITVGE